MSSDAKPHRVASKDAAQLAAEWDRFALERDSHLQLGVDRTYSEILLPSLLKLASDADWANALDFGCGSGRMTSALAEWAAQVTGVDMSGVSINLARNQQARPNVTYVHATIEEYASTHSPADFSLVLSNMVLMDAPNLDTSVAAISRLLKRGGIFVFTIAHPCFWPRYWGYEYERWFEYDREMFIEAAFRLSSLGSCHHSTTHVHRPLAAYLTALGRHGFLIEQATELGADTAGSAFKPPRFLAVKSRRV